MKNIPWFFGIQLFIGLFLSGCSLAEEILDYGKQLNSPTISENNQFASTNFPLESCSDSLPEEPQAYPLELYTVFIDGDKDQKLIEEKYCQKVLSFASPPHFGIQLGTFIGREKAEQFKEIISQDFDNVKITGPEILTIRSENYLSKTNNLKIPERFENTEKIAKAALLNAMQMQELLAIDKTEESQGEEKYMIRVVVPTYIPEGFELVQLNVDTKNYFQDYKIRYKNPTNNQCFMFRGGSIGGVGGATDLSAVVNANSRALGPVPMTFTSSAQMGDRVSSIGFHGEHFIGKTSDNKYLGGFEFYSPDYNEKLCESMSFVEAVKVAESLEFLQP